MRSTESHSQSCAGLSLFMVDLWLNIGWALGLLTLVLIVGWILHFVVMRVLTRVLRSFEWAQPLRRAVLRHLRAPLMLLFPAFLAYISLPAILLELPAVSFVVASNVIYILIVIGIAWLGIAGMSIVADVLAWRYDVEAEDNLQARKVITQMRILKRIAIVVIAVISVALILLRFEAFRELGTGMLASAGIVGLVLGIAAQRTLGNLLAGIQIAITQPIRVDDVVIIEGDFGWVEEITLTYVVVRVWDLRRIVVPISHFIENPFQNWTRTSSELLGTVFLYVDYTVPVDQVREKHRQLVESSGKWDGVACALQVTDTSERTVELRCLQSAVSAPKLFELRCQIREEMIAYLKEEFPESLPRVRADLHPSDRSRPDEDALTPGD